jgi:hypothetical protein
MSTDSIETFELQHEPKTIWQVESCVDPGDHHATHRRFTGLVNYLCNCGFSSGWVTKDSLPDPTDFLREHLPPGVEWPWPQELNHA